LLQNRKDLYPVFRNFIISLFLWQLKKVCCGQGSPPLEC
jgi:hypothetical protein